MIKYNLLTYRLIFLLFISLFVSGCHASSNKNYHFDFVNNSILIEKAVVYIQKKFPDVVMNDLYLIRSLSGHDFAFTKKNISKNKLNFYPEYFFFKVKSSTIEERFQNQTISCFDLITVGIYEDGTFNLDGEDVSKTDAISTSIKGEVLGDDVTLNLYKTTIQQLIISYGALSNFEVVEYNGPYANDIISCFTEAPVLKNHALKLIDRALAMKNIYLDKVHSNKIKAVFRER